MQAEKMCAYISEEGNRLYRILYEVDVGGLYASLTEPLIGCKQYSINGHNVEPVDKCYN